MMNNQLNVIPDNKTCLQKDFLGSSFEDSLAGLKGKRVIFRSDFSKEAIPLQSLSRSIVNEMPGSLKEFSKTPRQRTIASIDSSCALIGETEEGSIYAGRVAKVLACNGSIQGYYRAGPVLFYLDPDTVKSSLCSHFSHKISSALLLDRSISERFIRNYLERLTQIETAKSLSDAIILVDGALRPSILEPRDISLKSLQLACEENLNQLIGISKASSLRVVSNAVAALQTTRRGQIFLDLTRSTDSFLPNYGTHRTTAVKFASNSVVFRVDFSSSNFENDAQLLADLKFNDLFFRGYPETLRLAHHLSVFDSSTISSVRSYLAKKYGLVQVPSDDLRASILGKLI